MPILHSCYMFLYMTVNDENKMRAWCAALESTFLYRINFFQYQIYNNTRIASLPELLFPEITITIVGACFTYNMAYIYITLIGNIDVRFMQNVLNFLGSTQILLFIHTDILYNMPAISYRINVLFFMKHIFQSHSEAS